MNKIKEIDDKLCKIYECKAQYFFSLLTTLRYHWFS
jgi:hypothetical protein